jgi:hypothetical protein
MKTYAEVPMTKATHIDEYVCYWLNDDTCKDPSVHGYIGCSYRPRFDRRIRAHRNYYQNYKGAIGVPSHDFKVNILFVGTKKECIKFQRKLRPTSHIGWNRNYGGCHIGHATGIKQNLNKSARQKLSSLCGIRFLGSPKPINQREKMSTAAFANTTPIKRTPSQERMRLAKNAKRAARRAAGLPRLY